MFLPAYSNAKITKIKRVFQSYDLKCTATFFGSQCTDTITDIHTHTHTKPIATRGPLKVISKKLCHK